MSKNEELSNPISCLNRAREDELVFVLAGRDEAAPDAIREWARRRVSLGKNSHSDSQIVEALDCANRMTHERVPIFFFGCHRYAGHFMWQPGMKTDDSHFDKLNPWGYSIDGGLVGRLEHRRGWTATGRSDFSIDKRPGSHATFLVRGEHSLEDVKLLAKTYFPLVYARCGVDSWS